MRNKIWYRILIWLLLISSLILLLYLSPILIKPDNLAADDFGHFWAAGWLTIHGQNPYDPSLIMEMPYQVARLPGMLNPPWALPFVMILGWLSYPVSRMIWLLGNIAILIICAEWLWRIYKGSPRARWLAWILVFTFTPAIAALQKGQFTPLVLFGLVGFLRVITQSNTETSPRNNPWQLSVIGGCMLALIAIKPQMLYLFWLAYLLWCLQNRNWRIPFLGGSVVVLGTGLAMIFDHSIIAQYLQNITNFPLSEWATPTIGSYLRQIFGLEKFWLQFIPPGLGCIWFLYYWFRKRNAWRWEVELPLLLLVSMLTSPYSWTYDLIVVLPAIIFAAVKIHTHFEQRVLDGTDIFIIVSYGVFNILNIILHTRLNEFWFGWLSPMLLVWYLFANKRSSFISTEAVA